MDVKKILNYLAKGIAFEARGLNPVTAFAGQNKMEIANGTAVTDAIVEFFEPMDDARSAVIPGTPPTGNLIKSTLQVPMHWIDNGITGVSAMDIAESMKTGDIPAAVKIVAASCVEKFNNKVLPGIVQRSFSSYGAINAIPSDKAVIIGARGAMQDRGQGCYAPDDGTRVLLLDSTIYASLLNDDKLTLFQNVGDQIALSTGKLRPLHGFGQIGESSYFTGVNITAGDLDDGSLAGDHDKGKSVLTIKSTAGGKTLEKGSQIVIAGSTQKHTVLGAATIAEYGGSDFPGRVSFSYATIDQTGVKVAIYPPLPVALAADAAITVTGDAGIGGLAVHPMALVSVQRQMPAPGPGYIASDPIRDPVTNILWRVQNFGDYMLDNLTVDFCAGCTLGIPRYSARIHRTPWA